MTADHRASAAPTRPAQRGSTPDLVTMPLLDRLVAQSLDQDYEHVARRRGQSEGRRTRRAGVAVVAAFGLLVAVAAVQTRRDAPASASDRAALVEQINRENAAAAAQQRTLRQLRQQTTTMQRGLQNLGRTASSAEARARRLGVRAGYVAASGPGVRVVAGDGPATADDDGRIRDEDLAMLVDGLWGAGARAVSVNGIRLTALSPIRTSGVAIHVGFRPVGPPYTVLALGDTSTLQARFADTTHGLAWLSLVASFGFRFTMQNDDDLRLPAAAPAVLRSVRAAPDPREQKEDLRP